jgi:hypothetical protein
VCSSDLDGVSVGVSDGVSAGVSDGVSDGVITGVSAGVSVGVGVFVVVGVGVAVFEGVGVGVGVICGGGKAPSSTMMTFCAKDCAILNVPFTNHIFLTWFGNKST